MPTQQFKWKYRDTAARDLLQLVYHTPTSVRTSALDLLSAIRSRSINPELADIVLDESLDIHERRYALRAIISVSGDANLPSFAPYMASAFATRCNVFRQLSQGRPYHSDYSPDLLDELLRLADKHPLNRKWFFEVLKAVKEPIVVCDYLGKSLNQSLTDEFRQDLFETLVSFINQTPDVLTLDLTCKLLTFDTKKSRQVLNVHRQLILALCMACRQDHQWLAVIDQWDELCGEFIRVKPEVEAIVSEVRQQRAKIQDERQLRNEEKSQLAFESVAYRFTLNLYESAQNGDYDAYDRLRKMAKQAKSMPLQALSTRFIGQLLPQNDSLTLLKHQLFVRTNQGDELFDSPVRLEAGDALMRQPSADIWESLVNNYFIIPRNVYAPFQRNWITYLTDILSGEQYDYQSNRWEIDNRNNRNWFHELSEIDEKQLQEYFNF